MSFVTERSSGANIWNDTGEDILERSRSSVLNVMPRLPPAMDYLDTPGLTLVKGHITVRIVDYHLLINPLL